MCLNLSSQSGRIWNRTCLPIHAHLKFTWLLLNLTSCITCSSVNDLPRKTRAAQAATWAQRPRRNVDLAEIRILQKSLNSQRAKQTCSNVCANHDIRSRAQTSFESLSNVLSCPNYLRIQHYIIDASTPHPLKTQNFYSPASGIHADISM